MNISKDLLTKIPNLYAQEEVSDPIVYIRFFTRGNMQWFATEFDGEDTFFGVCDLNMGWPELGYFSLSEFEEVNQNMSSPKIIIDESFKPTSLSDVKKIYGIRL